MSDAFFVGIGYDTHVLKAGRPLVLGGATIPHEFGLDGHSDADVLIHAVMDALLGAACLPDIGHLFPNTDERFRGASSLVLLREVVARLRQEGYRVGNLDCVLIAERPKIAPYRAEMIAHLKQATGCDRVNVKATTNEGMNAEGEGRSMSAHAVALLFR